MKAPARLPALLGFGLAGAFALADSWTLPEFCWSTWLAGLLYAWCCVITACLQIILTARSAKPDYDARFAFLQRVPPLLFLCGMVALVLAVGWIAFHVYSYLFGFYGIFLSVFARMEPLALFGEDGFINSDFYTPVITLLMLYWPMALGALIANWRDFFRDHPWQRVLLPFQAEVMRMHFFVVALPFISLGAWFVVGEAYQSVAVVALLGLFYLIPRPPPAEVGSPAPEEARTPAAGQSA